jgi:hypothetical protein
MFETINQASSRKKNTRFEPCPPGLNLGLSWVAKKHLRHLED